MGQNWLYCDLDNQPDTEIFSQTFNTLSRFIDRHTHTNKDYVTCKLTQFRVTGLGNLGHTLKLDQQIDLSIKMNTIHKV